MWHEARKQEKLLRTMMVDYRRRAERRRDYYEKTKGDPAQFLQIHGRPCKIHLDPTVAATADSPATMMPWPGDQSVIIDRFDVRAHLDYIAPRRKEDSDSESDNQTVSSIDSERDDFEDRCAKYECYRILVQNEFLGVSEEKFLHQIAIEEQFGPVQKTGEEEKKKQLAPKKAAIGFSYEDSTGVPAAASVTVVPPEATEEDDSDSDVDLDLSIKVDKLSTDQMRELNSSAQKFGLGRQDFMNLLTRDLDQQEAMRVQKEEEQERALYSGRKRRKERRAFRQRKLQALLQSRTLSPPSYASRPSPTYDEYRRSQSPSKSRSGSPNDGERITFITSFGGDDSDEEKRKTAAVRKHKRPTVAHRRSRSPSPARIRRRSRERSRSRRSSSRTRTRHRSRSDRSRRKRSRSRSPSRSRSRRSHRRSRSRSRSRNRRSSSRSRRVRRSRSRTPPIRKRSSSSSSSSSAAGPSKPASSVAAVPAEAAPVPAPPPVRRYYGRRKSEEDSSSTSADEVQKDGKSSQAPKSAPAASTTSSANSTATKGKLTPQEKLKRKMQAALNKQYKADKRAEKEKLMKQEQERQHREEELRELSLRLRRKDREKRHGYRDSSASSRSISRSRSRSRSRS